jgi:hypothetical protein
MNIQIPYRPGQPLDAAAVSELPLYLPEGEERQVCRKVLQAGHLAGFRTVERLVRYLDSLGPYERREVLDQARTKARLVSATALEQRSRFDATCRAGRIKAAGDTRPLRLAISPGGAVVDLNERDDDAARARAEEESRQRRREDEQAVRAVEAEERRRRLEAKAAEVRRLVPPGVFS